MLQEPVEDPARASARLVESAIALARAELKLVASQLLSQGRAVGGRAAIALGLTWMAMTLGQIALLLLAISPLLAQWRDWPTVLSLVSPAVIAAVIAVLLAVRQWRRVAPQAQPGLPPSLNRQGQGPGKASNELHARV